MLKSSWLYGQNVVENIPRDNRLYSQQNHYSQSVFGEAPVDGIQNPDLLDEVFVEKAFHAVSTQEKCQGGRYRMKEPYREDTEKIAFYRSELRSENESTC